MIVYNSLPVESVSCSFDNTPYTLYIQSVDVIEYVSTNTLLSGMSENKHLNTSQSIYSLFEKNSSHVNILLNFILHI